MTTPSSRSHLTARPPAVSLSFDAIGVPWQIDAQGVLPDRAAPAIRRRISQFDATWSRFRDDSLVAEASRSAGITRFPAEGEALFALYRRLYEATAGSVTPFVGDTLAGLGYGPSLAGTAATPPDWNTVAQVRGSTIETASPVTIDIGAAGKGLLVDLVGDMLAELGATSSVIDASGDLRVRDADEAVRIALEHPYDRSRAIGVVELTDGALCASAGNRRAWGDGLHHVLDGLTGRPVRTIVATWAVAETAMLADGAATALFFLTPAEVRDRFGADGARMTSDGTIERTSAFPGTVFV